MKTLILSPLFPPQGSGAEISTMLECKELVENDVEVILVTNNCVKLNDYGGWMKKVKVYQIPMPFISFIHPRSKPLGEFAYWLLQENSWGYIHKIACKENVDLIHIEHAFIGFNKHDCSFPIILTIRDYWPICPYRTIMDKKMTCCAAQNFIGGFSCRRRIYFEYGVTKLPHLFYNMLFTPILYCMYNKYRVMIEEKLKNVDQIIAVSNFVEKVIKSSILLKGKKVEVIYPPIVEKEYVPRKKSDEITFTYIGGLEVHKGIMKLIYSFSNAVKKNNSLRLLICGDGSLRQRIQQYISKNKLIENVRLLGKIDYRDIKKVYEETDVVVVPSLWPEPYGRVVIESLVAGRLVIVNPVGGLREQIDDGSNGFYANCYNVEQLSEKILEIASYSKDDLISMGIKAREYSLRKFNPNDRIKKLLRIYEQVITRFS